MPNHRTFQMAPVAELVSKYHEPESADPFANGSQIATYTNDLNPDCPSGFHLDALDFLKTLEGKDLACVLFDPPYSLRQCCEVYESVGKPVTMRDTQVFGRWTEHKLLISKLVRLGGTVLSFGWNSQGMGEKNGFKIEEILLLCHGGAHNDTICTVERKMQSILL